MKKLIFSGFLALTSMGLVSLTSCNEKKNDSAVTDTMTNSVDTLLSDDTIDGSGNNESSVSESSESSSSNIDELIESYDKYVTDYIAFAKKAQKGDVSAMQDYAQMLENAQDLQEKLNAVEGEMTPEQLNPNRSLENFAFILSCNRTKDAYCVNIQMLLQWNSLL